MKGSIVGAIVGAGCLLLGVALAFAALPPIGAGQEYRQSLGWLDIRLDGVSLYFALLGLATLGLALLAGRWAGGWQLLPLLATYLIVRSYAVGEWPLGLRLAAELGAAAMILVGLGLVLRPAPSPSLPRWGRSKFGTLLAAWGMVALAVCSAEPSAVAGGLILAAGAAGLGLAISDGVAGWHEPSPSLPQRGRGLAYFPRLRRWGRGNLRPPATFTIHHSPFTILPSTFFLLPLLGLWLYLHAALEQGELLYAALMLVGAVGVVLGLLRLRPHMGWLGVVLAAIGVAGFAGGAALVDGLLRPALAGLAGLPAWAALRVQHLDLPAPQPDAAVSIGLQAGQSTSLLPLLAIALAFGFALALAWLLYRLLTVVAQLIGMRHEA